MTRPLIAVTCGTGYARTRPDQAQDRLFRLYSRAIANAGGIPVVVTGLEHPWMAAELADRTDGLLLTGGADIDPARYGAEPHPATRAEDPARDAAEFPIAQAFLDADIPILGICRGLQLLNVLLGGTLIQDIPTETTGAIAHRRGDVRTTPAHDIAIVPGSRLARIVGGTRIGVNSFHHQAARSVASALTVTARAEDGIVEGAEIDGARFVVAVQYHPEDMAGFQPHADALFGAFVEAACQAQTKGPGGQPGPHIRTGRPTARS